MIKVIVTVFLILHGLVHLLYLGQSAGYFELQPGMSWPDGSWVLSPLVGDETTRSLANILLALAALAFIVAGGGILAGAGWQRPVTVGAAVFSLLIFILLWDGGLQDLDDKGAVGLLINAAILIAVLIFHWPAFGS